MATALHNLSEYDAAAVPSGKGRRFVIVVAEWNSQVTNAMAEGAINALKQHEVADNDIIIKHIICYPKLNTGNNK